jgi:hypothetical protein
MPRLSARGSSLRVLTNLSGLDVAASRRLLETLVEGGATGRVALPWT